MMPLAIALAYSSEAAENLKKLGFVKQEVMVKYASDKNSGESEVFNMRGPKPFQFAVTDYWGMGPD